MNHYIHDMKRSVVIGRWLCCRAVGGLVKGCRGERTWSSSSGRADEAVVGVKKRWFCFRLLSPPSTKTTTVRPNRTTSLPNSSPRAEKPLPVRMWCGWIHRQSKSLQMPNISATQMREFGFLLVHMHFIVNGILWLNKCFFPHYSINLVFN